MWKLSFPLFLLLNSFLVMAQVNSLPAKHKQLFEFIKLPESIGIPLLTTEVEKFKMSLSLDVLNKINNTNPHDMQCLVDDLTDGKTSAYHLAIVSEMLNRYEYHESGYIPCKASRKSFSSDDLKKIKPLLWGNPILKNEFPSAYCRGRAYLTSKILDDLGFKSKMLTMRGNIFGTYKVKDSYKSALYLEHFVNVIEVVENNKTSEYVLDPMFTDGPLPLKDYLKLVTLPISESPRYEIKHQSYADKLAPPLQDESCQYNLKLLEDYESAIVEGLKEPTIYQGGVETYESPAKAKEAQVKTLLEFKP